MEVREGFFQSNEVLLLQLNTMREDGIEREGLNPLMSF
jgi:hypothetical protein